MWATEMSLSGAEAGQGRQPRRKARHKWPAVAREAEATVGQGEVERASPQTALRAIAALSVLTWLAVIAAVWGFCRLIGI